MNLSDPETILRLDLTDEEKISRNRKKSGWNVFFSRYAVDLKNLPYDDLKKLVRAENMRGVHVAPRPPPLLCNIRGGSASLTAPSPLRALAHAGLGGGRVSFKFSKFEKCTCHELFSKNS